MIRIEQAFKGDINSYLQQEEIRVQVRSNIVTKADPARSPLRFTLRQLLYFVAAGETRSVKQAAERLNISQPSISTAIAQIEAEFDIQLFVRHHAQGLSLTPAGVRFLQAAKTLLDQAEELHNVADEVAGSVSGPLNIGSFRTYAPLIISEVCKGFLDQFPRVKLHVSEGDEASLVARLRRAEISIAVTYSQNIPEDIDFEPLAKLPTYALLPADHEFVSKAPLHLRDLVDLPFILLDLPLSREYFMSLFLRENLAPNILTRTEYPEAIRSYVASGFGYSLATARPRNKAALNGKPLAYVPLAGNYPPMVFGLATLKGLRKTSITQAFEHHCRNVISTNQMPGMAPLG
ncbi:LysR family transcriptional regulator [Nordella sp. HKS 07]|uniref:LysR family transcriptional regulator n=1 Tax=Nordella sp. HKS 07 TaxID=2712222 RepID=UPI0019D2717A|nr:LysR family transcriptional regulator [Nordella sp. HKS 07]